MSSNFQYQPLVAVSGNLGGKVPVVNDVMSFQEQETYTTTSFDENCIECEFQTDRSYNIDLRQNYLAVKLKFVKVCEYETYNTKDIKKDYREETKMYVKAEEEQEAPVTLVTHVNNFLIYFFNVKV